VIRSHAALGRTIAVRDVPAGGGAGTLAYLLADHLGSTVEALDASGATITEQKYWPYGGMRSGGVSQTDKLYTGQQQELGDAALGLYNYRARFYSTTIGRFVSADPLVGSIGDPQSWNAYTYVRNNPLRLVDPTGMDPICFIICPGAPDQVVVEDGWCHACVGMKWAWIEEFRLGMIAGAAFQALNDARTSWVIGVVAYQNAFAARAQSGGLSDPIQLPTFPNSAGPDSRDHGRGAGTALGYTFCLGGWGAGGCTESGIAVDLGSTEWYDYTSVSGPAVSATALSVR
jgi:RHS repeat-associated protein